jgi:choline dehydrogenase-like flavoprotein
MGHHSSPGNPKMLIDLRSLPDGFRVDCDICIVGAGPAGLAVASMAGRGDRKVAILESGGTAAEPASTELAAGELRGDWHYPLETIRGRQLGGSAGRFGIRSADGRMGWRSGPLDPMDFETRSWVPESGWPFSRETLDPWYATAHEISGFGTFDYDPATWATDGCRPLSTDGSPIVSTLWHWGPQETFTSILPRELAARPNVDVYTHATATELISAPDTIGKITSATVRCIDGPSGSVSASRFVVAGGGIDNPRLLLLSKVCQPGFAGNPYGMVGRGFMEHQFVRAGTWYPSDPRWVASAGFYDLRKVRDSNVFGRFALSEDFQRKESLLNASALLIPRHARHLPDSVESLRTLLDSARKAQLPPDILDHLKTAASGADYIALAALRKAIGSGRLQPRPREAVHLFHGAGWSLDPHRAERYSAFDLYLHGEQAPDFENRVELAEQRDQFGSPRAALRWRWDDLSRESLMRWSRCFADAVSHARLGTVKLDVVRGRPRFMIDGCCHHMGTTRMHDSPRRGVVDQDCRVHGTENLYVAGSSVFPTGGEVNATLTLVALAARLGSHLQ